MLSKLIKHEWKTQSKFFIVINFFLIILTLVGILFFSFKIWAIESDFITILSVFGALFYYLSILAVSLGGSLYIASRFYKNLYTDEGYLTHTLPVSQHQLLLSKLITSSIWSFLTGLVVFCSIITLFISIGFSDGNQFSRLIFQELPIQLAYFEAETGISVGLSMLLFIIISIVSTVFSILQIFMSISIGQFYKKHKVLGSIVAYFCLGMLIQLCSMFVLFPIGIRISFASYIDITALYWSILAGIPIIISIISVLFYFVSHYILKKKLNLD